MFHFEEKPGSYSVGLKVVEQYDDSRIYRHGGDSSDQSHRSVCARPLQTLVWYPAPPSDARQMSVHDYFDLWATEMSFGGPTRPARAEEWLAGMCGSLTASLWAVRDAQKVAGRFPLVIYAPSFSSPSWENADLCEYLASHGYVVIASPSLGEVTREMTSDLAGVNAQARDISFLIDYAQSLPNTQTSAVAVAGFSWGGLANLFAAMRDDRIKALIALDGSLRYYPDLLEEAGDVHLERLTIPLLYFAQGRIPLEELICRDSLEHMMRAWTGGDLIVEHMPSLTHWQHSAMRQRNEALWTECLKRHAQQVDDERKSAMAGYGRLARHSLQFLNAYLKRDLEALALLKRDGPSA